MSQSLVLPVSLSLSVCLSLTLSHILSLSLSLALSLSISLSLALSLSLFLSLALFLSLSLSLGLVLCDYVRSNGELFAGKRVLELGAGNGLLGVVLSRLPLPPASIVLSDHHPKVCLYISI